MHELIGMMDNENVGWKSGDDNQEYFKYNIIQWSSNSLIYTSSDFKIWVVEAN